MLIGGGARQDTNERDGSLFAQDIDTTISAFNLRFYTRVVAGGVPKERRQSPKTNSHNWGEIGEKWGGTEWIGEE